MVVARARCRRRDLRAPSRRAAPGQRGRRSAATRARARPPRPTATRSTSSSSGATTASTRTCCAAARGRAGRRSAERRPSAPSAIARRGTDFLDCRVRGTDNAMYLRSFQPGTGWYGWQALGGNLTSGPALVLTGRRPSQHLRPRHRRPADAEGLDAVAAGSTGSASAADLTGAPSVVARVRRPLDLFVRGDNRALYQKLVDQRGRLDRRGTSIDSTPLDSTPAAVSDTPEHLLLVRTVRAATLVTKEWRAASRLDRLGRLGPRRTAAAARRPRTPPPAGRPRHPPRRRPLHPARRPPARSA